MTTLRTINDCGGLHGQVQVAPDGTVYLPNESCNRGGDPLAAGNPVWQVVTSRSASSRGDREGAGDRPAPSPPGSDRRRKAGLINLRRLPLENPFNNLYEIIP